MTDTRITGTRAGGYGIWRGNPTVEAEVLLSANGARGRAIAPAGASRGMREALDLRDEARPCVARASARRWRTSMAAFASALLGKDGADQTGVDAVLRALDPSALKATLGGNAMVAVSLAALHAAAAAAQVPSWRHIADYYGRTPSIPLPEIQIFGGGAHAGRRVDVQDFMVMVPGARDFAR